MDRSCENCRHFEKSPVLQGHGRCRRHAPRPAYPFPAADTLRMSPTAWWPLVAAGVDYCGEFDAAQQQPQTKKPQPKRKK